MSCAREKACSLQWTKMIVGTRYFKSLVVSIFHLYSIWFVFCSALSLLWPPSWLPSCKRLRPGWWGKAEGKLWAQGYSPESQSLDGLDPGDSLFLQVHGFCQEVCRHYFGLHLAQCGGPGHYLPVDQSSSSHKTIYLLSCSQEREVGAFDTEDTTHQPALRKCSWLFCPDSAACFAVHSSAWFYHSFWFIGLLLIAFSLSLASNMFRLTIMIPLSVCIPKHLILMEQI